MSTGYTVSTSQLRSVATELNELNGRYQQEIGRLLENKEELHGMWEGEANNAFNADFARSYESFNSFYSVIAQYAGALQEMARIYDDHENLAVDAART